MAEKLRNGYTQVGATCEAFKSDISLDQANELRHAVVWDFFESMPVKTPELTETSDKTMCAKAFHNTVANLEIDLPSVFAGAVLRNIDEQTWRLVIMRTKLRRARHNNAQQRVESRMIVEVFGDEVVEAVKRVKTVRGVGELTAAAIEQQMEEDTETGLIVMQRKAYERHITPQDCDDTIDFLTKVAKRAAA